MPRGFYVLGSAQPRPNSTQTLYCDGSADERYREGVDVELSHWRPNRTPLPYRADTSTEICLNFAARPLPGDWDVAINNHVDVDGVLSVFSLVEPELALAHREVLAQAATMGDFAGWGEAPAQRLFQSLTLRLQELEARDTDPVEIYAQAFEHVRARLTGQPPEDPRVEAGLAALARSVSWIEDGSVRRQPVHERFTLYVIPAALGPREAARRVPGFNEALSERGLLWPHARARWDFERAQQVSVEVEGGWHHDLWFPGYAWADTERLWRPPGLVFSGSTNGHVVGFEALEEALEALNAAEAHPGRWAMARRLSPFRALEGRGYPVVASFLGDGPSGLTPDAVAARLSGAFPGS